MQDSHHSGKPNPHRNNVQIGFLGKITEEGLKTARTTGSKKKKKNQMD